jgi:RsiW-degrading membrane proteinase PrsW (M82 family)
MKIIIFLLAIILGLLPTYYGAKKYCETKSVVVLYAYVFIGGLLISLLLTGALVVVGGADTDTTPPPPPPITPSPTTA